MTVRDRIFGLVETYAIGRQAEKALRRAMRALKCTAEAPRCYLSGTDEAQYCPECLERSSLWRLFSARRVVNKAILARLEALGCRLSAPEPIDDPGPRGALLDLLDDDSGRTVRT